MSELGGILGQHLRMVEVHDNHGRGDEHLAPSLGDIDWNRVLTELDRTNFRGGFVPELAGIADTWHLLATIDRLARRRIPHRFNIGGRNGNLRVAAYSFKP